MSETQLLVDGNNLVMRAVHAMEGRELSAHGTATGALVSFVNMVTRYTREVVPDRLVVCWDAGHVYRSTIFPAYKEGRGVGRSGYRDHVGDPFTQAKEFLSLAGVHHLSMNGVEADDLIAHYWRIRDPDDELVIASGDKDLLQLLSANVEQIRPGDKLTDRWTAERVRGEFGCEPEHLPLVMALTGDTSDSIPGIAGVGTKTACKWLAAHHWKLEELFAAELPRMKGQRDIVLRNLALVNLRDNNMNLTLPLPPRFHPTQPHTTLGDELAAFFERLQIENIKERWLAGTLWVDPTVMTRQLGLDLFR